MNKNLHVALSFNEIHAMLEHAYKVGLLDAALNNPEDNYWTIDSTRHTLKKMNEKREEKR